MTPRYTAQASVQINNQSAQVLADEQDPSGEAALRRTPIAFSRRRSRSSTAAPLPSALRSACA
jgi:uncharacterized protein involved in exopolysaccharide biosynthesis